MCEISELNSCCDPAATQGYPCHIKVKLIQQMDTTAGLDCSSRYLQDVGDDVSLTKLEEGVFVEGWVNLQNLC